MSTRSMHLGHSPAPNLTRLNQQLNISLSSAEHLISSSLRLPLFNLVGEFASKAESCKGSFSFTCERPRTWSCSSRLGACDAKDT